MFDLSITADGSHSIYSHQFDAYYHSVHGAIQETQVVFIDAGFNEKVKDANNTLNILELGFGTGLNAFMTYLEARRIGISINYETYELFPLGYEMAANLNYPEKLGATDHVSTFRHMHESVNLAVTFKLPEEGFFNFKLNKFDFHQINDGDRFDLIYFDAFAPEVQPELWNETFLKKIFEILNKEGILVTYCAKGSFKRALRAAGFLVESLPGPKGKREMTRAVKR